MAKTRIGIDVGSTAVRVAEVAAGDVPVVVRAAQVPLAPGVVEAGEVRRPDAVAEALREVWSKSGVQTKQVYLGVGNQRVIVREVALPWLPEEQLRDTLAFQVQEFIPMATDEAVLDFDPLGELDQGGRRMQRILLVAAHEDMINALVEAALAAKLDPVGVDLKPFAVIRAVGTGDEGLDLGGFGEEAIIDIGAQVTSICVHERGVSRFVRMLPSGGRDITLALASGLGIDEDVAERLKRGERPGPVAELPYERTETRATPEGTPADTTALPLPPRPAAPSTGHLPNPAGVRTLALARAGSFVDEVRSSLEFYAAQMPKAQIGRVLVVGGGSRLEGLLELLQERLQVPVDRGRLFERAKSELDLSAEAAAEAEAVLSVAVGLAIPTRRPA
ncbi:MAG TPA: type IV pilus assembly protein PilM [Actinomycetota bacterium]|nr:type IV pilus assembly protein PilM [Actinomycetota bacterium]